MAFKFVDEYPANTATGVGTGGGCFTCGAPRRQDERLVDLGAETDRVLGLDGEFYGGKIPVICEQCAVELGTMVGGLDPIRARHLNGELMIAQQMVDTLQAELDGMRELRAAISKVRS
jgi:hypothetical protein